MSTLIWGITDGSAGMVSQVRGVGELLAEKIRGECVLKSVRRRKPFCWLPGCFYFGALQQVTRDSDTLLPPYPDVIISSGRRSVAFALAIKKASGGKTKLIHLQNPRIRPRYFDLVVAMEHDNLQGDNVISTFAALHHITHKKLADACAVYAPKLAESKVPRALILMGGTTHTYTLSKQKMQQVAAQIATFVEQHTGRVWISTSRRTGAENTAALKAALGALDNVEIYAGEGENPYLSWLACADVIIITNDSVSMMSEAMFTGKPIYILPLPEHVNTKPANFAKLLVSRGFAKELSLPLEHYEPQLLDERAQVVDAILRLL